MTRKIINPRWANQEKTHIIAEFHTDDGKIFTASITQTEQGNPDWIEIMDEFGVEGVDANTAKDLEEHEARKLEAIERRSQEAELAKKEALFNAKSEAFDLELIRNSTNTSLKTALRRATTMVEVQAYATMILMEETNKQQS
jgi:hypothetical protein